MEEYTGTVNCPRCGFESDDIDLEICPKCGLDFNDYVLCPYKDSSNKCVLGKLCVHVGTAYESCATFISNFFTTGI